MAFASRYRYDVFVSYAHADDTQDTSGEGWVSQFVACLEIALRQRLGGTDELRLYFDHSHLHANHVLDDLLAAARDSAVFLAIASRSYAMRDWTKRELDAFVRGADDLHRLFAVECLPLDEGEVYPTPLQDHKRVEFWHVNAPHSQTAMPLSPALDPLQFHRRIHDVADQIRRQLGLLRTASAKGAPPDAHAGRSLPVLAGSQRTVLLAQVTEDLEVEREQVRRHLEQYGVAILPSDTYPQDGARFREAFEADLAHADLCVQLLGGFVGRAPPDLPEGYTRAQFAAAAARKVEILQWRGPDLDLSTLANERHRELLAGEHVMATGLETFKTEVVRRALRPPPPIDGKAAQDSLVFVNADRDDLEMAKQIQQEFLNHALPAAIPKLEGGSAEEIRTDIEESLIECAALVLVYGRTSPFWVRSQLRLFNKVKARRSCPPRVLAVYCGPPVDKQDLGFSLPDMREIDARDGISTRPVLPLIEALKA
jgi:hypothetical protein